MDPTKLLEWIKLQPRHLFATSMGTGVVLFAPPSIIESLGMAKALDSFRGWVGLVFIVSLTGWLSHGLAKVGQDIVGWSRRQRAMKVRKQSLTNLSPAERAILREFIDNNTKTITLDMSSGILGQGGRLVPG